MEAPVDKITVGQGFEGVVMNYGDPAYELAAGSAFGLTKAEEIFVRLIAYLVFAEAVCIPVRHVLEGDDMAQAMEWATLLLNEGLILPSQRVDTPTFEDYARSRALPAASRQRAEFLDRNASRVRKFRYKDLSEAYRQILVNDLGPGGCFRRTVNGGLRGRYTQALSNAHAEYADQSEGTPDAFTTVVSRYVPDLRRRARQWAMARYYTTPVLQGYDTANTRELPLSAAKLLIRGRALVATPPLLQDVPPVEAASARLKASIPAGSMSVEHKRYCEALLKVRQELPEARHVFSDICRADQLGDTGDAASDLFRRELARQLRSRPAKGRLFTLISSLLGSVVGGGVGLAAGGDVVIGGGIGIGVGIGAGIASNEIQNWLKVRNERRQRPWALAMDRIDALTMNE